MNENTLLGGFIALPVVLMVVIVFFFRQQKRSQKPRSPLKLVAGNTLIFLLLCSIGLLFGELYYRFVYDTTEAYGLSKTTTKWFERHFHPNRDGFRDSINYNLGTEPGKRRVTFLGDSFLVGHGVNDVEDRFPNLIRHQQIVGEVHVIGQCGFDTGHELAILQDLHRVGYELDVVVLVYCLNDITDIVPEWRENLKQIYQAPSPGFLLEESYFLNMLYSRWRIANEPQISDYYGFITEAYSGPRWEEQKQRLQLMRDVVESQGAQFFVVTFPFLQDLGVDYKYRAIHERLDEYWNEQGVPQLDLLNLYESNDGESLIVNTSDPHPNERAHALAAEAVAEFLKKQLQPSANPGEPVPAPIPAEPGAQTP